ncbi:helix-turn-helix transcriptional regulator [uncultured Roseovarius sp.]|uniref:helix-turn-helix transcriptional regulator n=1 Tax=uncultured Roseovarius sp. TaxID=293344 RepID=UPI0025E05BDB|nr:helix-turn-helix transcriptional regulator [uncultured Roseovarius sp.]
MTVAFKTDKPQALIALIAVQSLCAAFFLWDVVNDLGPNGLRALANLHIAIEALAALALVSAIVYETRALMALLRRKAHLENQVSIAAGAFHDIMLDHFQNWGLTAAEQDVAGFTIKGLSIAEIADLRGSAEGTVKSQLNAIYRKAGVPGRGALLGLLVDDLMNAPLTSEKPLQKEAS